MTASAMVTEAAIEGGREGDRKVRDGRRGRGREGEEERKRSLEGLRPGAGND